MSKMYAFIYPIIKTFLRVFHPWKSIGRENLPEGGVLICGNHTSLGDPLYVLCCIGHKPQCRVMAKQELMEVPVLGFLLKKAGIIGVNRGKSDVAAIKECMRVLKNGEKLLIFPEGTRVKEGEKAEGHTGAALLATRTGVPILPVYIQPKKRWFRRTTVIFGQPYQPEYEGRKPNAEDYQRITDELMSRIHELGAQL